MILAKDMRDSIRNKDETLQSSIAYHLEALESKMDGLKESNRQYVDMYIDDNFVYAEDVINAIDKIADESGYFTKVDKITIYETFGRHSLVPVDTIRLRIFW